MPRHRARRRGATACDPSPCPSCRWRHCLMGERSVSRPIEGLDSLRAVRTLRSSRRRAFGSASRCLMALLAWGGFEAETRGREASAVLASVRRIRSVRTAPKLSSPSMGRDTPPLPKADAPTGRVGRGLDRMRDRRDAGGSPRSANHARQARPPGERAEVAGTTEPAESAPFRPDSDARQAGEPSPGPPCRSGHVAQERPPRSGGPKRRRQTAA